MTMVAKIEGVKGSCQLKGHEDWIILSGSSLNLSFFNSSFTSVDYKTAGGTAKKKIEFEPTSSSFAINDRLGVASFSNAQASSKLPDKVKIHILDDSDKNGKVIYKCSFGGVTWEATSKEISNDGVGMNINFRYSSFKELDVLTNVELGRDFVTKDDSKDEL